MDQDINFFLKVEQKLTEWTIRLIPSDYQWLGRTLLRGLRFAWRHKPIPIERIPKEATGNPLGPFKINRRRQLGDLLLWVPRRIDSFLIDDLTGSFGYSHLSVDTGEVDLPTGKPVMAEVTVGQTVKRKFQDEYMGRDYARIPLSTTGINPEAFVNCILSRLGEPYDTAEALTLGEIDDPAKQMCSSLASECLPEKVQRDIARARRLGLLRGPSVSVHSPSSAAKTKIFISPNGFAQYYGVPEGEKLGGSDILIEPHALDTSVMGRMHKHGWKAVLILGAAVGLTAVALLLNNKYSREKN